MAKHKTGRRADDTERTIAADWVALYRQAQQSPNGYVCVNPEDEPELYAAPAGCDLLDESAWRAANPALGTFRSLDDLREQLTQAQRMPSMENSARNLLLNQRVSTVSPFISPDVWKACSGGAGNISGTPVWCGIDLSARLDLTAMVIVGQIDDVWHVQAHFWTPEVGLADRARRDPCPL